jgi:hypothetical protein
VRTEPARRRRTLLRRVAVGGALAVIAIGGAVAASIVVMQSQRIADPDIAYCLASPHRDADGRFAYAAVSLHESSGGGTTTVDPIAACEDMWRRGALDEAADQLAPTPAPHAVPASLQLCVMDDGSPAVVPGDRSACQAAGLRRGR